MYYQVTVDGHSIEQMVKVHGWGSAKSARRLGDSSCVIKADVLAGKDVRIHGAPKVNGETTRRVIERGGRLYCRMLKEGS